MNCLCCGTADSRVTKSYDDGVEVRRMRNCPCGARWSTTETSEKRTLVTISVQQPPLITRIQPPVATNGYGGVGGGLSSGSNLVPFPADLILSQFPDPDPSEVTDQVADPAREAATLKYPAEFELLWEETGKRGVKFKALGAWKKAGKPTWDAIGSTWLAYLASDRPTAGYTKDLSSWLTQRCHTQTWEPARHTAGKFQPGRNAAASWLERQGEEEQ